MVARRKTSRTKQTKSPALTERSFDVHRDSADFRDSIYQPALIPLDEQVVPHKDYINIRDQRREGACTGFGLAAVIDYLNQSRGVDEPISARMLYEMAKRHDRWPGEDYEGSSARGAMKGWHKNGVAPEIRWPYKPREPGYLTAERQQLALRYPLGAYYRVMPRRADFHAALNEVPAIFATAAVHKGWERPRHGIIEYDQSQMVSGGHAFAILGYNDEGFIIQNSWGPTWGGLTLAGTHYEGLAIWTYADFEHSLWDAWVARMARPVESLTALAGAHIVERPGGPQRIEAGPPRHVIRDHYIHIDDGAFDPRGDYPSHADEVQEIVEAAAGSGAQHVLLYAHGGVNSIKASASRVSAWHPVFAANAVYELHFIWETGFIAELRDILFGKESFANRRAGGFGDWKDRVLEKGTHFAGRALWKEMISDAELAFEDDRAGTALVQMLIDAVKDLSGQRRPKLHLVGHSAGSIWFAHLLRQWRTLNGPKLENLVLYAPACTHELFDSHIRPAITSGTVKHFHHYLLDDETERDDHVGRIYGKSLLYLVSNSYQKSASKLSKPPVPLLGMEKFLTQLSDRGMKDKTTHYITTKDGKFTTSTSHGGFDNDSVTMNSMLRLILGLTPGTRLSNPFREENLSGY
ncbi:MAG: C1 family peptidase [Acidiferrobacterales bacterium]